MRLVVIFGLYLVSYIKCEKVLISEGWLEGERRPLVTGDGEYYSFKGIPYAAPPLGARRFKAPQPPVPWKGTRNATQHGAICIQYDIFAKKLLPSSEDCLFLNVYTPDLNPKTPLPVMVFIHGGGYESGSGDDDRFGPDFLVKNDVILVTINYRLEVLGYLNLGTKEVPGNAGMKDQVAALKWIQKNIDKFGGDPDNVTLFGQSAGAAAVILHMMSPISKGLLKRAISMSGVPTCDWSIEYKSIRRAFVLGKQLGLDTTDPNVLLKYLQGLPAEKLANASPSVLISEDIIGLTPRMFHFTPVAEKDFGDDHFLTVDPQNLMQDGKINQVDLMIGHTNEEGIEDLIFFKDSIINVFSNYPEMLVPRNILYTKASDKILEISDMIRNHYFGKDPIDKNKLREVLRFINDLFYRYEISRVIRLLSNVLQNKMFVYNFSGVSKRNIYGEIGIKYNLTGASHSDDTVYIFDPKHANLGIKADSKEFKMVKQTSKLYTDFAKFGNPTPDPSEGVTWPAYDKENEGYLEIGEKLTPGKHLNEDITEFWQSVFEKAGVEF